MIRSSCGSRTAGGFTLIELLTAGAVLSIVLTGLCGIYFAISKEWERQQGESEALTATSLACSRLSDYVSQATGAIVDSRFTTNDTLILNMPADSVSGAYVPVWSGGVVKYRSGSWLVFYLSDSTGRFSSAGRILWAATMTWSGYPASVSPDSSWSLYYGSSKGRISPLVSIRFALDSTGSRPSVTITAVSNYKIGATTKQITQSRTVCLRNAN
jgi:Tfp pilus assembly protein PilV